MDDSSFWIGFALSVGLGGLVGLEREHHRNERKEVIAGVRTFPLISLSGYMMGILSRTTGELSILPAGILFIGLLSIAFLVVRHRLGVTGLTSPAALVVTFLLGMLVSYGFYQESIVLGLATTFLLLTKERLHGFAFRLEDAEILGALQFLALAFVALPLASTFPPSVENVPLVGRGNVVDPYRIVFLVVLISAISFLAFLAMRLAGTERGAEIAGLLGGLVNSEATAAALGSAAKSNPSLSSVAQVGIALSISTMLVRIGAIAALADPSLRLVSAMGVPLGVMVAVALLGAAFVRKAPRPSPSSSPPITLKNPFAVGPAVTFALLFALFAALAYSLGRTLGSWGVLAGSLAGLVGAGANVAGLGSLVSSGAIDVETARSAAVLSCVFAVLNKFWILKTTSPSLVDSLRWVLLSTALSGIVALGVLLLR